MNKWIKRIVSVTMAFVMAGILFLPAASSAKENQALKTGSGEIVIDGYYDDWEGFPSTDLTYYSNNTLCVHKGHIYCDGDYLYVNVNMNDMYNTQMSIQSFVLKVNDKETAIPILGVKEDGSIDWSVPIYGGMSEGTHTNLGVFLGYYTQCDSSVAFTVHDKNHSSDTKGDQIEFRISMKDITKYFGIDADSIDTIAIKNPNIGGESIIYAGSSTAPLAGAAAGFVFVACTVGVHKYTKKRKTVQ